MLDTRVSVRAHRDQRAGRLPLNPNKYLKLGSQEIPQFPKRKVSYPVFFVRSHPHKHRHSFERHRRGRVVLVLVGARSCPVYSELPNITANFNPFIARSVGNTTGAFSSNQIGGSGVAGGSGTCMDRGLTFNAKTANALYRDDCNDVRVNALFGLNLIRAF